MYGHKIIIALLFFQICTKTFHLGAQTENNTDTIYTVLLKRGEILRESDQTGLEKGTTFQKGISLKFSYDAKMLVLDQLATTHLVIPEQDLTSYYLAPIKLAVNFRDPTPIDYSSLQQYFSDTLLVLGDQMFVSIKAPDFPVSDLSFFYLSYVWSEEPDTRINKKLTQNKDGLFLKKAEIFTVDKKPISEKDVTDFQLFYRNSKTNETTWINNFFLLFPDTQELRTAVSFIIERAKENELSEAEIIDKVYSFIDTAYASPDTNNFYGWVEQTFSLGKK